MLDGEGRLRIEDSLAKTSPVTGINIVLLTRIESRAFAVATPTLDCSSRCLFGARGCACQCCCLLHVKEERLKAHPVSSPMKANADARRYSDVSK